MRQDVLWHERNAAQKSINEKAAVKHNNKVENVDCEMSYLAP